MRSITFFVFLIFAGCAVAQRDTIVVTDYTKVMMATDSDGKIIPITALEGTGQAGFFINTRPEGQIRICHSDELFVWVNGKLIDVINECKFYEPSALYANADSDTLYVSLSSKSSLADLKCEVVIFEELLVVKDEVSVPRAVRSEFKEFTIIALLLLLGLAGVITASYPSRISYLVGKTFTFKISSYEFVNTNFLSGVSMNLVSFYALSLAFIGLYLNGLVDVEFVATPVSLGEYLWKWIQLSVLIFMLVMAKWVVITVVAQLFKFRGLKNFQLFDYLNFSLVFLIPVLLFLVVDFILNTSSETWISSGFIVLFPITLILFVVWFTLKFVNNSPRKKLVIISYLCATEIIPAIILLGFFYK
ncbi:DUF4271 domain-containing protein [Ekhidna sp.]|uniref:DUF4271 domain-containing protein n=1 Tax=Ekhidna sp. TaxID=2608089 RepID=UPI003516774A